MNEAEFNNMPEKDRMNRVLEGQAFYACLHQPNTAAQKLFGEAPCYKVVLVLDTPQEVEKAESYGLKVNPADAKCSHPYVTLRTKIKEGKKPEDVKPEIIDSMQDVVPSSILIGNGSRIKVKFLTYWHKMSNKFGAGNYMTKVQVLSLVKYTPPSQDGMGTQPAGFKVSQFDDMADDIPFDVPKQEDKTKGKKVNQPASTDLDKLFAE